MSEVYVSDKAFEQVHFGEDALVLGEYEGCTFTECDFNGCDLSGFKFLDCQFVSCNLSNVDVFGTVWRDVQFTDCKMLGLRFDKSNEFALSFGFEGCVLNHSSFFRTKIKKTIFKNAQLQEADFTDCELAGATFEHCDLTGALFENTVLEKADLRTSFGYSIDPELNRIKKAKFSLSTIPGLLSKYDIEIDPAQ